MNPNEQASKLVAILEGIAYPHGRQIERVFETFVTMGTDVMRRACFGDVRYEPDLGDLTYARDDFARAYAILLEQVYPDYTYEDIIGLAYMQIASGGKRSGMGQYFTPMTVARMMAKMMIDARGDEWDRYTAEEPFTILDPACGSGIMLLAAAAELPREVIDSGRVEFSGIDLDPLCVAMARLNVALYGLWVPRSGITVVGVNGEYKIPRANATANIVDAHDLTPAEVATLPEPHRTRITEQLSLFDLPATPKRKRGK